MADPNTVTAAELQALAVLWDNTVPANHVYWMMVDAIGAASHGLYQVDYLLMPPISKSAYFAIQGALATRGFALSAKSIDTQPSGLRKYWLHLSWEP